ncbi:hypothetical protein ACYSNO_10010 [Enterococcus sp. LJL98]
MKFKTIFFTSSFSLILFLGTGCVNSNKVTDIFELKDTGKLDIVFSAIINDRIVEIENGTNLDSLKTSTIQINASNLDSKQSIKVYFDKIDAGFPITDVKNKNTNALYSVVESYDSEMYPEFFTVGSHTIKIFQYDPEPGTSQVPSKNKINDISTITYQITD